MPEKDRFPIRYGRGHNKVTIYNRTTALPFLILNRKVTRGFKFAHNFCFLLSAFIHAD